jgi:hypothetical protein
MRNVYKILGRKPEGKKPHGTTRQRLEVEWIYGNRGEGVDWIEHCNESLGFM